MLLRKQETETENMRFLLPLLRAARLYTGRTQEKANAASIIRERSAYTAHTAEVLNPRVGTQNWVAMLFWLGRRDPS
jgi:hypothetical protein